MSPLTLSDIREHIHKNLHIIAPHKTGLEVIFYDVGEEDRASIVQCKVVRPYMAEVVLIGPLIDSENYPSDDYRGDLEHRAMFGLFEQTNEMVQDIVRRYRFRGLDKA